MGRLAGLLLTGSAAGKGGGSARARVNCYVESFRDANGLTG